MYIITIWLRSRDGSREGVGDPASGLWEYINRSQTHHECGNWYWGCAVWFLGIHKWDLLCFVLTCRWTSAQAYNATNQWSDDATYWHDFFDHNAVITNLLMDLRASSSVMTQWLADGPHTLPLSWHMHGDLLLNPAVTCYDYDLMKSLPAMTLTCWSIYVSLWLVHKSPCNESGLLAGLPARTLTCCFYLHVSLWPVDKSLCNDSDLLLSFHAEEDLSVMTTDIRSPDAAVPNFLKEYL